MAQVSVQAQQSASVSPRVKEPCLMVIFGASGDLTKRLLLPAILNLRDSGLLPEQFAIVGVAKDELTTETFRNKLTQEIQQFTTRAFDPKSWEALVSSIYYISGDFADPTCYQRLSKMMEEISTKHKTGANRIFYYAIAPSLFGLVSERLGEAALTKEEKGWARVIVEKPFGHDLASAVALNKDLQKVWEERQIFRIDHYLGKETVQNILAFRFANSIWEPLWNRKYIEYVEFTVAEEVGVEGRAGYYDKSGALRDMFQNHMFQVLSYIAMQPPSSFRANEIRDRKAELINDIRRMTPEEVSWNVVRGQYGPGIIKGKQVPGYLQEPGVDPKSTTETFLAAKLFIDNWRWAGVPFFLRTGKHLPARTTEIRVHFLPAPEVLWKNTPVKHLSNNELIFHIQPQQSIGLVFEAKVPGPAINLETVEMDFEYKDVFQEGRGTGYETLLYDCMVNEQTLFSRADLVETAWSVVQPILDAWEKNPGSNLFTYPAGTWGPPESERLERRGGHHWSNAA